MLCHTHCNPSTGTQDLLPEISHSEPEMLQGFLTILSLYFDKAITVDRWQIAVGLIKHCTPDLVLCTTKGHKEWISFFLPVPDYFFVLGMPLTDHLRIKLSSLRWTKEANHAFEAQVHHCSPWRLVWEKYFHVTVSLLNYALSYPGRSRKSKEFIILATGSYWQ